MVAPARRASWEILQAIELGGGFSDALLHSERVRRLRPVDRNLTTQITYGTLRWQGWLDHIVGGAVRGRWDWVDGRARILLRMSLYQMSRMTRLPDHAVINDAVELAKQVLRGRTGAFVNGVLRRLGRERPWTAAGFEDSLPPWVRVSLPQWIWERWQARFGREQAAAFALSLNQPPCRAFWEIQAPPSPEGEGIRTEARPSELVPGAWLLPEGFAGELPESEAYHFQDEASQLIPQLLGSVAGMRLWDSCAAPGGKCALLSRAAGKAGFVMASDRSPRKAQELAGFLGRAAISRFAVVAADAAQAPPFRCALDAVLVDAPCSGLGTLRRNPEIKWRFRRARLSMLGEAQTMILQHASGAVRPGGRLLYSTCSTEPEENEQVVDRFLAGNPQFRLERPQAHPGIDRWVDDRHFFRSFPGERMWDGFFAALISRKS